MFSIRMDSYLIFLDTLGLLYRFELKPSLILGALLGFPSYLLKQIPSQTLFFISIELLGLWIKRSVGLLHLF